MNEATPVDLPVRASYRDTDQMAVVYHANYLVYFEMGRVEWLRQHGMSYRTMEQRGVLIPLTSASLEFKRPAHFDDLLVVRTRLAEITRVRLRLGYELLRDGELLATGETAHVFADPALRPVRVTQAVVEFLRSGTGEPPEVLR